MIRFIQMAGLMFLAAGFFAEAGHSQSTPGDDRYSFEFRGESMSEALDRIIRTAEIDLVYDPDLVRGVHVYQRIREKRVQELLDTILHEHHLDYLTLSSGTIVIVRSVAEGPFFGTFSGKITDRQTGEPLPGATVLLADASGGTSTNQSGNFSLNRLMTGTHTFIFSYVGYEPVIRSFEIGPNEQVRQQISLLPKPVDTAPLVVEAHRPAMPSYYHPSLAANNTAMQPAATMRSPIRSLGFMPGVQYGLPMTDLHLQGGQQTEHRILLDGIPIYNPYSFGQLFSSFSPYAIGTIDLQKAGYGAHHGSQIAGIINLNHDLDRNGTNSATLQADPLSLNLRGDLKLPLGSNGISLMTALRTNFWNIYQDRPLAQTLENWDVLDPLIVNSFDHISTDAAQYTPYFHDSMVKFFDYHLAASTQTGEFSTLSGSFYMAENRIETLLLNQRLPQLGSLPYLYSRDYNAWNNLMARIGWNSMVTPRFDLSVEGGFSSNRFNHASDIFLTHYPSVNMMGVGAFYDSHRGLNEAISQNSFIRLPAQIDGNKIQHGLLKAGASYSITPAFSLDGGLQADYINSRVAISDGTTTNASVQTEDRVKTDQTSVLLSSYLTSRHRFGTYWSIDWGSRLTYASHTNTVFAEPRASVQYDKNGSAIGYWSMRLSGGLYRQFINEYKMTSTGPAALAPSFSIWSHADASAIPKAWHLNGSFLVEPDLNTSITLEAYYKWQPVTNITTYRFLSNDLQPVNESADNDKWTAFGENTEMTALGGGVRLNRALAASRLKLMAGYDYSYSRIDMATQFGRTMPAPWNEPHRVQLRALWHLSSTLSVISKWQGIWGRAWAFRDAYYNILPFRNTDTGISYSFGTPEQDKLPHFYQLDVSMVWQPQLGPAELELRLDLINLLNRKNSLDQYLAPNHASNGDVSYEIRHRTFPGFYPSISISSTF